jgi:hypothetical protein
MRAQELIQAILSIIDGPTEPKEQPIIAVQVDQEPESAEEFYSDELRRMKQIAGLREPGEMSPLSNAPNPQYADVDAVTVDAGGGPNQPKHPADIRGNSQSLYPVHQHNPYKEY